MTVDLLGRFPYPQPREVQKQALEELQRSWDEYDVFVISAPTATGKTALAKTIMNAARSTSYIAPTNLLVDQFRTEFPDTATLSRLDSYHCEEWDRPCPTTKARLHNFCRGCPGGLALATAKYKKGGGAYNYHIYTSHKIYRDVLIVDEAHNLLPHIRERLALKVWQHDYSYPANMYTIDQVRQWLSTLPPNVLKHKKIEVLRRAVYDSNPEYVFERRMEEFSGKGTVRGEPEMRDVLFLLPVDITTAPPIFWPREVKKIILMSATIGPLDIEALGLTRRRVLYIDCQSPIPPENRPIIMLDTTSVNRHNLEAAADVLAQTIDDIATYHAGEKGVVHATYQLAGLLKARLTGDRYIFHTRDNKKEKYQEFREAGTDRILVASGMYEGIDLPGDLGRWQCVAKIPWPSLGNSAVAHLTRQNEEWYFWETLRVLIQACGRICRTPEDYGITYCLDSSVHRLIAEANHMIPTWFSDALKSS